jgi:hypothetical protein
VFTLIAFRQDIPVDDFEKWRRRTVYVVQCFTTSIARTRFPGHPGQFRLRALRNYRNEAARQLRSEVARRVTDLRKAGLTMKGVRDMHEGLLRGPGYAERCGLEDLLSE